MRKGAFFLAAAFGCAFLCSQVARAEDVELADIKGRWCSDTSDYTFSSTQLHVVLHSGKTPKHGNYLKIAGTDVNGDRITVKWKPEKPGNSTEFELSKNRRELVQLPQSEGDKGPRRVFHRC